MGGAVRPGHPRTGMETPVLAVRYTSYTVLAYLMHEETFLIASANRASETVSVILVESIVWEHSATFRI